MGGTKAPFKTGLPSGDFAVSHQADVHLVRDRQWFIDFTEYHSKVGNIPVVTRLNTTGFGTIAIPVRAQPASIDGKPPSTKLIIEDALYAPRAPNNLLSLSKLFRQYGWGIQTRLGANHDVLCNAQNVILAHFDHTKTDQCLKLYLSPSGPRVSPKTLFSPKEPVRQGITSASWSREESEFQLVSRHLSTLTVICQETKFAARALSTRERHWLATNYGSEHEFLSQHGFSLLNDEDRRESRSLARNLMRQAKGGVDFKSDAAITAAKDSAVAGTSKDTSDDNQSKHTSGISNGSRLSDSSGGLSSSKWATSSSDSKPALLGDGPFSSQQAPASGEEMNQDRSLAMLTKNKEQDGLEKPKGDEEHDDYLAKLQSKLKFTLYEPKTTPPGDATKSSPVMPQKRPAVGTGFAAHKSSSSAPSGAGTGANGAVNKPGSTPPSTRSTAAALAAFMQGKQVFGLVNGSWLYSTDANCHIATHRSYFIDYENFASHITSIDGTARLSVIGVGTVSLPVHVTPGYSKMLMIHDVLHVPTAVNNVLSQAQLADSAAGWSLRATTPDGFMAALFDEEDIPLTQLHRAFGADLWLLDGVPPHPGNAPRGGVRTSITAATWPEEQRHKWYSRLFTREDNRWLRQGWGSEHAFMRSRSLNDEVEEDLVKGRVFARELMKDDVHRDVAVDMM